MTEKEQREKSGWRKGLFSFHNTRNYAGVTLLNLFIKGFGYIVITSYFSYFYVEYLNVPIEAISLILGSGIIIDAVSDFSMGILLDRIRTRFGRAKHWLLWMGIPLGFTMAMVFWVPDQASMTVKLIYAAVTYNLYCCCMTGVRIPSQAMSSLGSNNDRARTVFAWCSSAGSTLATLVSGTALVLTLQYFGGESEYGYRMTLNVFAAATGLVVLLCGALFEEGKYDDSGAIARESDGGEKPNLKQSIYFISKNRYWWIYFGFHFFETCIPGVLNATLAYFCAYVLEDPAAAAMLLAVTSLPSLIGQTVDLPLLAVFDNTRVGMIGFAMMVLGCLVNFVAGVRSLMLLQVGLMIRSFGLGMFNGVRGSFMPRIIDYGEWKNGVRQDGMVNGGTSVLDKIASAMLTIILGFVLKVTGYTSETMTESSVHAISFLFLNLPFICSVIGILLYMLFDLDYNKIVRMRSEIKKRQEEREEIL